MVFELATVLLGVCVGAIAVLYAAPRGFLGHSRKKGSSAAVAPVETTYTPTVEQIVEAPAVLAPAEVTPAEVASVTVEPATPEPALTFAPPLYETVQPEVPPAPVTYAPSPVASFGASPVSKKPTRTYRRRTAPVRSTSASRTPHSTKTKKR